MSKVVQLRAAIAPRGFALPKHLNLMSSDAGDRARPAGLIIVLPAQVTRSPNASLRANAVFMMLPQMIALERRGPMGGNARERHSLSAVTPNRPSINVRISPPEHLARLQRLTLHQLPSSRSCSRGRDGYRFTCLYSGVVLGHLRLVSARHRRP